DASASSPYPVIEMRDEPLADATRYRRLHVVIGDANMSEVATYLKVGTTALLLDMVEDGVLGPDLTLQSAVSAIHDISSDRMLQKTLSEALDIRLALGPCLAGIHGPGSSEFEASYVAARELCRRLDDRTRVFPTLWGLCHVSFNRGLYREARSLGQELLSVARERGDSVLLLESHHSLWTVLYGSGDLESAELHVQEGLSQYDPQRHHPYASVYGGHDPGACCLNFAALTAWMRGYPDRAIRYSQEALRLCARLGHPRSTSIALYYAAWVHY